MYQENKFFQIKKNVKEIETQKKCDKYLIVLDKIIKKRSYSEFNEMRQEQLGTEHLITEISGYQRCLTRLLNIYGMNDLKLNKIAKDLFEIKLSSVEDYELLDSEYAYKGGIARAILEKELGFTNKVYFRDIDLLRTTERDFNEEDEKMAIKYSPDDLRNGHGIEQLQEDYFDTRDFTINELLVVNDRVILTTACLLDTARGIIRFADYEKRKLFEDENNELEENKTPLSYLEKYKDEANQDKAKFYINDKLMAKALRFSVIQSSRRPTRLADEEVYKYLDINNFHIALHLDRALEEGIEVAQDYIKKLIELGQLSNTTHCEPKELMKNFIEMVTAEGSFIFRVESLAVLETESQSDALRDLARSAQKTRHINNIEDYL